MSGGHDKSALGVASGDYDMAGVASDVFERMVSARNAQGATISASSITSPLFPTSSFAYAHDLNPDLAKKISDCFFAFRLPAVDAARNSTATTASFPITYKDTWKVVREIAEASGTPYNKAAYDAESEARGRGAGEKATAAAGAEAVISAARGRMDASTPFKPAAADAEPLARHPQPAQGIPRRASRCSRTSRSRSRAAA